MRVHPDFGRGRLRYNRENKRKIDELWEEITLSLNSAGSGPQKLPKEWAKTWRDWKSNLLKRVATYKSYAAGTGGGQPKTLDTSPSEEDLLDFLTPEASGMSDIPEGGAIDDSQDSLTSKENSFQNLTNFTPLIKNTVTSQKLHDTFTKSNKFLTVQSPTWKRETSCSQRFEEHIQEPFYSDVIDVDEDLPINISSNVLASIQNIQEQIPKADETNCNPISTKNNKRYSDDADIGNKKLKKQNVKHLFQQHTLDYNDIQERILQLKKEKLAIQKENLEFKKKHIRNF